MRWLKRTVAAVLAFCAAVSIVDLRNTAFADFAQDEVRMAVDKDVPEKGTLEELPIPTYGRAIKSYCEVYLPYGYDQEDKTTAYDVIIMLPGASGNWTTFFTERFAGMTGKEALDSVYYYKQAKPAIVVTTASFRTMRADVQHLMIQYVRDIVQELNAHYNTYGNPDIQVGRGERSRDSASRRGKMRYEQQPDKMGDKNE